MKTILDEAEEIVAGQRQGDYGPPERNLESIAKMWSVILNHDVSARHVGLCMIALKLCRETNSHKRDNLVDIAGYALLVDLISDTPTSSTQSGVRL